MSSFNGVECNDSRPAHTAPAHFVGERTHRQSKTKEA